MYIWGPRSPGKLFLLWSGSNSPSYHYSLFFFFFLILVVVGVDPPVNPIFCILSPCHLGPRPSLYVFQGGQLPGGC